MDFEALYRCFIIARDSKDEGIRRDSLERAIKMAKTETVEKDHGYGSRRREQETVILDGKLKRTSDKAVCVSLEGNDVWFPRSQIIDISTEEEGDEVTLEVTQWIADQKGL